MKNNVREHIEKYCVDNGFDCNDDDDIIETLQEAGNILYTEKIGSRRWWDDYFCVNDLDGMLIGFNDAQTTGDNSPFDVGWEFDMDSICEAECREEQITRVWYTPVKD